MTNKYGTSEIWTNKNYLFTTCQTHTVGKCIEKELEIFIFHKKFEFWQTKTSLNFQHILIPRPLQIWMNVNAHMSTKNVQHEWDKNSCCQNLIVKIIDRSIYKRGHLKFVCVVGTLETLCNGQKQNACPLPKTMFTQELFMKVHQENITHPEK